MDKKPYNMQRRNQAVTRVLIRALACGYLLYLACQLAFKDGGDPTFPLAARIVIALLFAAAAVGFGVYSWKRYCADCKEAEEDAEPPELDDGDGEEP